jgi:hypothetical protein
MLKAVVRFFSIGVTVDALFKFPDCMLLKLKGEYNANEIRPVIINKIASFLIIAVLNGVFLKTWTSDMNMNPAKR